MLAPGITHTHTHTHTLKQFVINPPPHSHPPGEDVPDSTKGSSLAALSSEAQERTNSLFCWWAHSITKTTLICHNLIIHLQSPFHVLDSKIIYTFRAEGPRNRTHKSRVQWSLVGEYWRMMWNLPCFLQFGHSTAWGNKLRLPKLY